MAFGRLLAARRQDLVRVDGAREEDAAIINDPVVGGLSRRRDRRARPPAASEVLRDELATRSTHNRASSSFLPATPRPSIQKEVVPHVAKTTTLQSLMAPPLKAHLTRPNARPQLIM